MCDQIEIISLIMAVKKHYTFMPEHEPVEEVDCDCLEHKRYVTHEKCPYCYESDIADIVGDELAHDFHTAESESNEAASQIYGLVIKTPVDRLSNG